MGESLPPSSKEVISPAETKTRSETLAPELQEDLKETWQELQEHLETNTPASIIVYREGGPRVTQEEALARQIMMAGLGVKGHEVYVQKDERFPDGVRYDERIFTNIPGVQIRYADHPEGGRWITLEVGVNPDEEERTAPSDIVRVLRMTSTYKEWTDSIERYGGHWNVKKEQVAQAEILALDIDDCVFPSPDRRPTNETVIIELAHTLAELRDSGMRIFFVTGRAVSEVKKVLTYFEQLGTPLDGAIAEGGALALVRDEAGKWETQKNPEIDESDWAAIQACKQFITQRYLANNLGYAEPKQSAATFKLKPNSGYTGFQIRDQLRAVLIQKNLSTAAVENADVNEEGIQLFPGGVDKAAGMRFIQKKEGCAKEQIIGVGDSKGDIPLFAESGITAAPFNAAMEARLEADYYSPFDTEFGVLEIAQQIRKLKQGNR